MLTTLQDLQNSRIKQIASACSSSGEFISLVNDATRTLMKRGNFWGTVQPIVCAAYGGEITWPAYVGTVLALNVCDRPTQLQNRWYQFMPFDTSHHRNMAKGYIARPDYPVTKMVKTSPVFQPLNPLFPMPLRFFIDNATDAGQTITIFGKDSNGQVVNTLRPDGTYQDGLVVTLAYPSVDTAIAFQRIDRVLKTVTNGVVRGYAIDIANSVLRDLAYYLPYETSPDYQVSHIPTPHGVTPFKVEALVKLSFVPVSNPQDMVLIENIDALKVMIQSIKAGEAGDIESKRLFEAEAFRELNYELRDKYPLEQFTVSFRPFGTARLERQAIGTNI
jgi:hypothetical protein